ncbi:MAG TPA: hypothetical protein PK385_10290 [Spirochaetota bacterium]|nr:hypothetical protein [Spirochaetota bacterium]HOS33195.1 hypothetical protein [Spirochaetota bacterium]HOS56435.1 hypothetical protein [Spirochaetota bacterium]HPK61346.1 hypothetical protein [Spirochaetota bacterium]HQF78277.1 hypothetical protein [Spirochaetota bacterium]
MTPTILKNIKIPIPTRQIFARLGYRVSNEISENEKSKINNAIEEAIKRVNLSASYIIIPIESNTGEVVSFSNNFVVNSKKLAEYLNKSKSAYLVGVTAGTDIVAFRDDNLRDEKDMFTAVIADAVGSETVEGAIDYVHEMLIKQNVRLGKIVKNARFSPGYGDLSLVYQREIARLLALDKLGVSLSETNILYPEKSVTAFIGLE